MNGIVTELRGRENIKGNIKIVAKRMGEGGVPAASHFPFVPFGLSAHHENGVGAEEEYPVTQSV
jgi:hypothetical protein